MAEAIVSQVLGQLASIIQRNIDQEVRLVVGVSKEVKLLTDKFQIIQAVLVDAEQRKLQETAVQEWLDQLKDASYDTEDVLDEWNTAMLKLQIEGVPKKKVCLFFTTACFRFKQLGLRHDIAHKIKAINENMDEIVKRKEVINFNVIKSFEKLDRVQSSSLVDVSNICGRVEDRSNLVNKLLCEDRSTLLDKLLCKSSSEKDLHIISIVGMGGIGKTTLAQVAYNDNKVMSIFNIRIWVCVSNLFNEHRIAKAIIEALEGSSPNLEFNSLIEKIQTSITGKKFLLVLDDVWTENYNYWEPFYDCLKNGLRGSKILITTRNEKVARMMKSIDIIPLNELSEEECWLLFKKIAFFSRSKEECEELEETGRKIVKKCKGLPLAAKTIGSLLRFKTTRKEWIDILNSEMWKIEEIEKGLFSPLLLSYNDLPSILRRCFLYCAIFPKDYKDELILLWMAQGYLELKQNIEMEIIGQKHFDYLATRSFFQDFRKDDDGNIIYCKMHDMVHDFAQFMTKNECFNVEVLNIEEPFINPSHKKVLHAMLMLNQGVPFPKSICSVKKLRSLICEIVYKSYSVDSSILSKVFGELTYLRTLDISRLDINIGFEDANLEKEITKEKKTLDESTRFENANLIKEIPKQIGNSIYLRYLNLSHQKIKKLPDIICELYNLQTLNLTECSDLEELPQGMGKLLKLRHLINRGTESLSYMPIGLGRLTCLRTLSEFVVSGNGGVHDSKACCLEYLKDLNHLQGKLTIRGLGRVTNVGEIKRKQILKDKRNLCPLVLRFDRDGEGERIYEDDDELVLEALQPPLDLEKLEIYFYRGNAFSSSWMTTLTTLRKLELFGCENCKHLSPLGKLPLLESLYINRMDGVKRIGDEFWGIGIDDTSLSSSSSSVILFPKLKFLQFWFMENWEEWDYEIKRNGEEDDIKFMPCLAFLSFNFCGKSRKGEEDDVKFMPCLAFLSFNFCAKLKALPEGLLQRTTLRNLEIYESPLLEALYRKETGECWHIISHIPNIRINPQYVQGGASSIAILTNPRA